MSKTEPKHSRWMALIVIAVAIAIPAAVGISYYREWQRARDNEIQYPAGPAVYVMTPMGDSAIVRPKTKSPIEAQIDDNDEVIGVEAAGRYRAYRLRVMAMPANHIVNDLLGDVPVTVTFCDLSNCVQGFTSDEKGTPLNIIPGGYFGDMLLRSHGVFFKQTTGLPMDQHRPPEPVHALYPVVRMKWKEWRELHPTTDVFDGK